MTMTNVPEGALIEIIVSDDEWTIGYINGVPALWEGRCDPVPEKFYEMAEESEFDVVEELWQVLDGRWEKVEDDE